MKERIITYDINHDFGNDIGLNGTKDLQVSSGLIRSQQRVLRRLLTNPGDYIWHPTYGAGLPRYVGRPLTADLFAEIKSRIISNIFLEESVSKIPVPNITLTETQGNIFCEITYIEQSTQQPTVLSFNITNDAFTT